MEIFTERLNKLIKENKTTMYRIAKEIKCSKSQVTYWCNGTSEPKITYLKKLSIYFNVPSDYLLGLEDETGTKYINSFNNFNNSGYVEIK